MARDEGRPRTPGTVDRARNPDDAARVDGYLAGDAAVFREVDGWIRIEMRHRYPGLGAEHDDLGQAVHARLLGNLRAGRFEGRSALRTYVTGITHHVAIDRAREIRRRRKLLTTFAGLASDRTEAPPSLEHRDRARLLHRALMAVPASCRELWRLVFLEKLSYEEIGLRLTIPEGTVKSRMWHCRRKLVDALARIEESGRR